MNIEEVFPNRQEWSRKVPIRSFFGKINQEALTHFMERFYDGEKDLKKKYEISLDRYNNLMKEFIGAKYFFPSYEELGQESPANVLSEMENHIAEHIFLLKVRSDLMWANIEEEKKYKESQKTGNLKNFKL